MRLPIDVQALREESVRKTDERAAVEIRVSSLVQDGLDIPTVALRVGISQSTIHRILRKLRAGLAQG